MQLEIYALAVERLILTDASPVGCGYWFMREKGHKSWLDYREGAEGAVGAGKTWERRKDELVATILRLVRAMRDGQFPMYNDDEQCTGSCEYHKTCRVNQARALEKVWRVERGG